MFENAIAVLERSGHTQFWLVMLALFPMGILLIGVWIIPTDAVPQSKIARLVFK